MSFAEHRTEIYEELKEDVLNLAEYLGSNGPEMWVEMHALFEKFEDRLLESANEFPQEEDIDEIS